MSYQITYYGHGTFGMTINDNKILIDPYFSGNPSTKINPEDLTPDYILITHGHGDHVGDAVEIAKRSGAIVIANAEIAGWMSDKGAQTSPQHIGGGHDYPFGYVKLTLAVHGSALPDGSYGGMPAGFLITEEGVHLAVLPIGDNYTMGPDDALRAVKLIQPQHVIPGHYNTWPLIAQDPEAWKKRVETETDTIVHVMNADTSQDF